MWSDGRRFYDVTPSGDQDYAVRTSGLTGKVVRFTKHLIRREASTGKWLWQGAHRTFELGRAWGVPCMALPRWRPELHLDADSSHQQRVLALSFTGGASGHARGAPGGEESRSGAPVEHRGALACKHRRCAAKQHGSVRKQPWDTGEGRCKIEVRHESCAGLAGNREAPQREVLGHSGCVRWSWNSEPDILGHLLRARGGRI